MQRISQLSLVTCIGLCTLACEPVEGESTITEDQFLQQFEEIYCGQHEDCVAGEACPAVSTVLDTTCLYDATYAQDCLAGEYVCEDGLLLAPTTCAGVYDCDATTGGGGTTTGGGTYPTGTYPTGTTGGEP